MVGIVQPLKEVKKPDCFNRPDYKDEYDVQDGRCLVVVKTTDCVGRRGIVYQSIEVPKMVRIQNTMSKDCKQNGPLGAATIYGWDCAGCRHYATT